MCPPGHHLNGFMATHALGHMAHDVQLRTAGTNEPRVLNKLSKERNISVYTGSTTQRVLKSPNSKMGVIYNTYVIMKTMCLPRHHHNGFMETHALGHMM